MAKTPSLDELKKSIEEFERRFDAPPVDWGREVTHEEVRWLSDHYPFLQLVAAGGGKPSEKVEVIKAESTNWNIIDYGDAMGASPGYYVFSSGYFRMSKEDGEDDEEGGSMVNPGKGTIINQAFLTAQEMVQIGISRGWYGVHLVDYHRLMGRAAWIEAQKSEVPVSGFEPDRKDKRIQGLLKKSSDQLVLTGPKGRA